MSRRGPYKVKDLSQHMTERDVRILLDLEQLRLLDSRTIQQLHFPVGDGEHLTDLAAMRACNRVLVRLAERDAIVMLSRRIGGITPGSTSIVWQLGKGGERLLRARSGRTNRRRYFEPTYAFMEHTLAVARTLAGLVEASRDRDFEVLEYLSEPDCWRPFTSPIGPTVLKPDLYVVTADAEVEAHSFVEVDRGTEHLPTVLQKCRVYQDYWGTGRAQEELQLFPSVVWIVPDDRRARLIREAIERDAGLDTGLFHVTTPSGAAAVLAPSNPKGGNQ